MTLTYACTYVNTLSLSKARYHSHPVCKENNYVKQPYRWRTVGYCVGYAWLHYNMDVAVQGRSAFPKDNVGKAMCMERDRSLLKYGYSEL